MTLYDWLASLWRTLVPYFVGFAAVQLARLGITMNDATLTAALTAGFGTVYYALFRLLEQRAGKAWGWFLGLARPPHYPDKSGGITITAPSGSV